LQTCWTKKIEGNLVPINIFTNDGDQYMSPLISNALIYGLYLSILLAIVMLVSFGLAPDMWVGDYPPDIQTKYGEMSPRAKRYRPSVSVLFFGSILVVLTASIINLHKIVEGDVGFWDYFLSSFITLMVFNLFDLLIADWLIFVTIQPKAIILPGTEGMTGYKDYWFHFRGFLIGIGFSTVGALIIALIAVGLLG
jgi:hypothetical protein